MKSGRRPGLAALALAAALVVAVPGAASAVTRNVAPGGSTSDKSCTAVPCELEHAVEDVAQPGDDVAVQAGTHMLDVDPSVEVLRVTDPIDVHGIAGGPRPVVRTSRAEAIVIDHPGAHVSDLEFDHFGTTFRTVRLFAGVVERVYAKAADTVIACEASGPAGQALIRDSVCWNVAGAVGAGGLSAGTDSPPKYGTLVNVTAVSRIYGVHVRADSGSENTIDARNVIASSSDIGGTDAQAVTTGGPGGPGDTATLNLSHSNYATAGMQGAGSSVTPPGSGTNQTAEPIFADPAAGDFHQLDGSPTIDAGGSDPLLGSLDIDRQSRVQGPAPDIGADEGGVPGSPPLPPPTVLDFEISAPVRARVQRIFVRLICEAGPCAFRASGKMVAKRDGGGSSRQAYAAKTFRLRQATATAAAGETRKLRLKVGGKARRKVEDLLARDHEAKARIKVVATDPSGNRAVERTAIEIKR